MSNENFDEKKNTDSPVDFSDLGPLFAPETTGEKENSEESPVLQSTENDTPISEENVEFLPSEEIPHENSADSEENSVEFTPENIPSVDFSDLGPLFSEDAPQVQAGEAALVLKKLSELSQENASAEAAPEISIPEDTMEDLFAEKELDSLEEEASVSEENLTPIEQDTAAGETDAPTEKPFPEEETVVSEESAVPETPVTSEQKAEISDEAELSIKQNIPLEISEAETPQVENSHKMPVEKNDTSAAPRRPTRKGRPKRKKGEGFFGIPNLLVTVVWIAITVLIGVTLGRMAWVCAADVLAFGREDKPVTITVYEADTIEDITRKLHEGGLVKYPGLFKLYASLAVDEGEIHPGIWDLNTRYDYHALVNMMSPSSSREVIELMIPEGYSCRQIFALMEENKICTSLDLGAYAAGGELDDYWFLEGVPRGDMYCLEGYLFPDTYQFYKNDSPRNVLTKMLNNFESRFDEAMVAQIDTLNARLTELMKKGGHGEKFIAENLFTVQDVINVASLIEKETSSADEGYVIASVIYNRLFNWPDNVPYLNIDATIVYALGGKNKLTQEDLKVNSPYNTYTHTGLTPGPIANPGLSSIRAALDPSDSNYYYYVLDPALGSHRFSTTYDEHKANIASIGD